MATPSFNRRAAGLKSIGAKRFLAEDYARAPGALKTLLGDEYIIGDGVKLLAKMQGLRPLKQNTKDRTESQSQVPREKEKEKRAKKQKEQQKRAEQKKLESGENKNAAF
ncbi:uncharacterized protein K444DRAFT_624493 [Hyaloscypha bicolor E]|uniref:Uncharacterized protein n=1 Tax=Hyaloscypha bicolor E TaxID=1095630 RepID=A0A2J6TSH1_9HELO|nr:uncharacterized protein K444DRAFT_624493 [Hyaloscypha bicolor E]PMD65962.1 hypothetical protein K444DRAFT_624493 [Hyaloscypha bicolor E]